MAIASVDCTQEKDVCSKDEVGTQCGPLTPAALAGLLRAAPGASVVPGAVLSGQEGCLEKT